MQPPAVNMFAIVLPVILLVFGIQASSEMAGNPLALTLTELSYILGNINMLRNHAGIKSFLLAFKFHDSRAILCFGLAFGLAIVHIFFQV